METTQKSIAQLHEELNVAKLAVRTSETDADFDAASLSVTKIKAAIKSEEARIAADEKMAKFAELKNEKIAVLKNYANAVIEAHVLQHDKKAADADKIAASENRDALYEDIVNELLKGIAKPAPVKTSGDGTANVSGTRGGKSAEILAFITPLFESGMTGSDVRKQCKEHGGGSWAIFNDGTANAVIVKYEREHGLK